MHAYYNAGLLIPCVVLRNAELPLCHFTWPADEVRGKMSSDRRITVLARHLDVSSDSTLPRALYLWLTRDNVELRDRMLKHLMVLCGSQSAALPLMQ